MRALIVTAVLLGGCEPSVLDDEDPGTSVGNPNRALMQLSVRDNEGVLTESATMEVGTVVLESCGGYRAGWPIDDELDLYEGHLSTPPLGAWCSQLWRAESNVVIEGEVEGNPYRIELLRPSFELEGTWVVQEDSLFVMEFGLDGWLDALRDPVAEGREVEIGPRHPLHDRILMAFIDGIAIYADRDGDGEISDAERRRWRVSATAR